MGLISDRKNKKKEQYKNSVNVVNTGSLGSFHPSSGGGYHGGHGVIPNQPPGSRASGSSKKGIFGPQVLPSSVPPPPHHVPMQNHPPPRGFNAGVHSRSGRGGSATSLHHPPPPHHHPVSHQPPSSGGSVQKYPAGYYTTPVHHTSGGSGNASWSHPGQPRGYNPNVNPRYQTWVAPRKQPALGQLVR